MTYQLMDDERKKRDIAIAISWASLFCAILTFLAIVCFAIVCAAAVTFFFHPSEVLVIFCVIFIIVMSMIIVIVVFGGIIFLSILLFRVILNYRQNRDSLILAEYGGDI